MGRRDLEGPIHRSILAYLRYQFPGALIFHPANEIDVKGKDVARAIAKAKSLGMLPGIPDLVMLHEGHAMFFEVKAEGNYQTPTQKAVQTTIEENNGSYAVVRSIEDVREALREFAALPVSVPHRGVVS